MAAPTKPTKPTNPTFFATPAKFRAWLEEHHETETELLVGFHKRHTSTPSITWPESVDEALCFGWIDGVRRRIDDVSYSIRFTPRKKTSTWSAINIARVAQRVAQGGHDVPRDRIVARYHRTMALLPDAIVAADWADG